MKHTLLHVNLFELALINTLFIACYKINNCFRIITNFMKKISIKTKIKFAIKKFRQDSIVSQHLKRGRSVDEGNSKVRFDLTKKCWQRDLSKIMLQLKKVIKKFRLLAIILSKILHYYVFHSPCSQIRVQIKTPFCSWILLYALPLMVLADNLLK